MLCFIASDIHTEFHRDNGKEFFAKAPEADVFICAGDLGDSRSIENALVFAKKKYEHIVFVPGNHEYYGSIFATKRKALLAMSGQQVHVLDGHAVEINGQRFVGATLWFPQTPDAFKYRFGFSDFQDRLVRLREHANF